MSAVKVINKKQVLQQSNCNYEVTNNKEDDVKVPERNEFPLKNDEEKLLEIENQCSPLRKPEKIVKSEALKLRNIRLDLSSLKHSVIQKVNGNWTPIKNELSSDEFSEDDWSKKTETKRKLRPVVPNYVTNTDRGPNRKPRQSKQEHLVLSSQTSPKLTPQVEQPLSIARRNARERYRVKQVNEGFTALRNKIPEYISKVYKEEKEKKKKNTKKLSKVETLRMAVDYIRHLETLLDLKSTEKDVWVEQAKTETQPCTTPPSSDQPESDPTPVQVTYLDPPAPSYIVPIQYQPIIQYPDRVYYKYELPNDHPKETNTMEKRSTPTFMIATIIGNENQCVNELNFYETLSRIKKEQSDDENEEDMEEEQNEEDMDISPQKSDPQMSPKPTDVIIKVEKNDFTLPPIAETFTKTIPCFY